MARAEVRDIEIAYDVDGSGEPVVLIGGFSLVKESREPSTTWWMGRDTASTPGQTPGGIAATPSSPAA